MRTQPPFIVMQRIRRSSASTAGAASVEKPSGSKASAAIAQARYIHIANLKFSVTPMRNTRGPRYAASPPQSSPIISHGRGRRAVPRGVARRRALFAVSLEAHMMAALGTAAERFDPLVRSALAFLQGQPPLREIAISQASPCPRFPRPDTPVLWQMRLAGPPACRGRRLAPRLPSLRPNSFSPLGPRRDHGGAAR